MKVVVRECPPPWEGWEHLVLTRKDRQYEVQSPLSWYVLGVTESASVTQWSEFTQPQLCLNRLRRDKQTIDSIDYLHVNHPIFDEIIDVQVVY